MPTTQPGPLVILGVAASDSHAVANALIAHTLRGEGFTVVNLGTCTPLTEFADAYARHPDAIAVVVGSVNGHAYRDVSDLPQLRGGGALSCPVVLGGNLKLGAEASGEGPARLRGLGIDHIIDDVEGLVALLHRLAVPSAAAHR